MWNFIKGYIASKCGVTAREADMMAKQCVNHLDTTWNKPGYCIGHHCSAWQYTNRFNLFGKASRLIWGVRGRCNHGKPR